MAKNYWQLTPEDKQRLGAKEVKRLHDEAVKQKIMPDGFDPKRMVTIDIREKKERKP